MAPCVLCPHANPRRALVRRPKTLQPVCTECFFHVFEQEIHHAIIGYGQAEQVVGEDGRLHGKRLFQRGERVAIGASGGKGQLVVGRSPERAVADYSPWQIQLCWLTS